jgi:hypothetical protein
VLDQTSVAIEDSGDQGDDFIPRHIVRCRDSGGDRLPGATEIPLKKPVQRYFQDLRKGGAGGFRCIDVAAFAGDGTTTAARMIGDAMVAEFGRTSLRPRLDDIAKTPNDAGQPAIFRCFSQRTVLRCARAAGIRRSILPPFALKTVVLVAGVALTVLGAVVASLQTLQAVVVGAVVNVGAQLVLNLIPGGTRRSVLERVIEVCATRSDKRDAFVKALSDRFASWRGVRCVVVDTFAAQDDTTREVLADYLERHADQDRPELWVVFDQREFVRHRAGRERRSSTTAFRREVAGRTQEARRGRRAVPYGLGRVHYYDLAQLGPADRRRLATRAGHPERAGFTTIKAITGDESGGLTEYFDEIVPRGGSTETETFRAAQMLYLLSLESVRDAIAWPQKKLERRLQSDQAARRTILGEILGLGRDATDARRSPVTRPDVAKRLRWMVRDFEPVLVISADNQGQVLSVSTAVADELAGIDEEEGSWVERGLVAPSLGHMFWALYRSDHHQETVDSLYWADVLGAHLVRAVPTDDSANATAAVELLTREPEVAHRLRGAFDTALADAVALGHLDDVVDLLRSARHNAGFVADKAGDLRAHARDIYAVTLAADVLGFLLEDGSDGPVGPSENGTAGYSLISLFTHAQPVAGSLADADAVPGSTHDRLRADLEIRGTWLALSLQPFVPSLAPILSAAFVLAHRRVGPLARSIIDANRENPATTRTVADWTSVSMAIWCLALSGEPARRAGAEAPMEAVEPAPGAQADQNLARALRDTYRIAAQLRKGGRSGPTYLRDGMVEELLTITAAASIYALARWELRDAYRDRVAETLGRCLHDLGIASPSELSVRSLAPAAAAVAERLRLLQITWKALGYEALAVSINVRRAQFEAETVSRWRPGSSGTPGPLRWSDRDARSAEALERSIVDDRDRPDLLGLIANLASAEDTRIGSDAARGEVLVGEILLSAVTVQLNAEDFSEDLLTDLCVMTVDHNHAHPEAPIAPVMAYLLASPTSEPGEPRLRVWLRGLDDSAVVKASNWLSNVGRRPGVNRTRVDALIDERIHAIADESLRDRARDHLDVADLGDQVQAGEVTAADVLGRWRGRRDRPIYAFVLNLIFPGDPTAPVDAELIREAVHVLSNIRTYVYSNGSAFLAHTMCRRWGASSPDLERSAAPMDPDTLVVALRESFAMWAPELPIERAMGGLYLLRRLDPGNGDRYTRQLAVLSEQRLLALEQREVTRLGQTHRYALLLLAYTDICTTWGLTPIRAAGSPREARPGTAEWEVESQRLLESTPAVLVRRGTASFVSGHFLDDVRALFESDRAHDDAFGAARDRYDTAARKELPALLNLLADLEGMPARIHQILLQHREKVLELDSGHHADPTLN